VPWLADRPFGPIHAIVRGDHLIAERPEIIRDETAELSVVVNQEQALGGSGIRWHRRVS